VPAGVVATVRTCACVAPQTSDAQNARAISLYRCMMSSLGSAELFLFCCGIFSLAMHKGNGPVIAKESSTSMAHRIPSDV
jgi:hypothetical protein